MLSLFSVRERVPIHIALEKSVFGYKYGGHTNCHCHSLLCPVAKYTATALIPGLGGKNVWELRTVALRPVSLDSNLTFINRL